MTTKLRAIYDGRVIIPEGLVDLPIGQALELEISELVAEPVSSSGQTEADVLKGKNAMLELIEKWAKEPIEPSLPADYATQIDHYLYGTPKRDTA